MKNINTKKYWDDRFKTGDWEQNKGRNQTKCFAISQIPLLKIDKNFTGIILDFGCGLGDAFPIYKDAYPKAKLIGLDISEEAIKLCRRDYGNIAEFIIGDYTSVPKVDIIIASNVFEHLSEDKVIAKELLLKCKILKVIVPYKELLIPNNEHINFYDEFYFDEFSQVSYKTFFSKGWGPTRVDLVYNGYFKNIIRLLMGRPLVKIKRLKQIMFTIK
jgi:SAM-dependent methyltransferase